MDWYMGVGKKVWRFLYDILIFFREYLYGRGIKKIN